jgi:uncharacterized membrane protein
MKLEFYLPMFEQSSNIKFHENPSSGSRVVRYGDMTKLIIAFRNIANAIENDDGAAFSSPTFTQTPWESVNWFRAERRYTYSMVISHERGITYTI